MAEWFKAHAWKACVGNTTVGSNPTLSASFFSTEIHTDAVSGNRVGIELCGGNFSRPFIHRQLLQS